MRLSHWHRVTKPALAALGALLLAACATQPRATPPLAPSETLPSRTCYVASSSDWQAWVNAMPGPGARPTLIVTGKVVTPTGNNRAVFDADLEVRESYPVQVSATVRIVGQGGIATAAFTTHDVRGEWPMSQPVGSVTVRCGAHVLATISPVETAH
jgi:hypothetical protein